MPGRVIYVVRSWPRLSQTFVLNEVLALERRGIEMEIFAMTRSGEAVVQPQVADVRAPVTYLDDVRDGTDALSAHAAVLGRDPRAYAATTALALARPGLSQGYATATTRQCLKHAVGVAARVQQLRRAGVGPVHVHAHFAHDPALVAMLVNRLTGVPYSVTGHARDVYQVPAGNLAARVERATTLVTCCTANAAYLRSVLPPTAAGKVRVIHHGVDTRRFSPPASRQVRDVPRVVSVGRLVEKKGFADLLEACAAVVAAGHRLVLEVYGDGPLRPELERRRRALGLGDVVTFAGEHDGDVVLAALRSADAFVLTPFVTDDGDRDGVPNVVVEALACGLPVVTTAVGGIPEAVGHRRNGLLGEPHDVRGIAAHLAELLTDPALRRRLGVEGRRTVEEGFDVDVAAGELVDVLGAEEAHAWS